MNYTTAIEWANGHSGAMGFLTMLNRQDEYTIEVITEKLLVLPSVRGRNLNKLWAIANKNFEKMRKICENCPDQLIIEACSREDYTGREMINQYLK